MARTSVLDHHRRGRRGPGPLTLGRRAFSRYSSDADSLAAVDVGPLRMVDRVASRARRTAIRVRVERAVDVI